MVGSVRGVPRYRPRLAGPVTAIAGGAAVVVAAPLLPAVYQGAAVPTGAGACVVGAVASVDAVRRARRREQVAHLVAALTPLVGQPGPSQVRVRVWRGPVLAPRPVSVLVRYVPEARTHDPKWLALILEVFAARTGVPWKVTGHQVRRCRLRLDVDESVRDGGSAGEVRVRRTVSELLGPTAVVTAIDVDDAGQVCSVRIRHENGTRLAAVGYRARVERTFSAVMPGRWRARWDLLGDRAVFERRPTFPDIIALPPAHVDAGVDPLQTYDEVAIEFGVDEDGRPQVWRPAIDPNLMVVGSPGTGKTSLEHDVLVQVSRYGWPIWVADGKAIEFLGFRTWPNVQIVATRIEEQVALIERAWQLMEHRYQLIVSGRAKESDFEPLMVFVDEYVDLRANLLAWYVSIKGKGDPTKPPVLDKLASIARKGRSSRVHLLFSTQRPDAEYFGGDMRDNFRMRISTGRLSPQGAMMMWQDPAVGISIPRGCRGRATTINDDNEFVEIQCYFIPDPRKVRPASAEENTLAAARPVTARHERLIILPPQIEPDLDGKQGEQMLRYADYVNAAWVKASEHSAGDTVLVDDETPEDARSLASPMTVLGLGGGPGEWGVAVAGPGEPARDVDEVDEFAGYAPQGSCLPGELEVGDLVLDCDSGQWLLVDAPVEEDLTDPENMSIFWRTEDGEDGHLSVPADDHLSVRRAVIEDLP